MGAMRALLAIILALGCALAAAQSRPPKLEPLPEPPPPPAMSGADEPRVRIPVQEGDKVEEIREGGRVVGLRVTPPGGRPYFLIDPAGNGNWMRRESLDTGLAVPQFPVKTFD